MTEPHQPIEGEILLFTSPGGGTRIEVFFQEETFWLSQRKMADLFGVEVPTINYHLKEIYKLGELDESATIRKIRIVQMEGSREVGRDVEFHNSDWTGKLDSFLQFNEYELLTNAGHVSKEVAQRLAEEQYAKFRVKQDQDFVNDFERQAKTLTAKSRRTKKEN